MITDPNICAGGERAILNIFSSNEKNDSDYHMVNRLIETCACSSESLSTLYKMFKQSVFAVAFSITSDYHLSEDCVAETFIRLTQIKNFNPNKGDGKGFILTVARNVALEIRRQNRNYSDNFILQCYGEADSTVENSIYINQLLMFLNDKQRQIVVMKCCSDMSFKEISKIMKCPESTVKSRYKKAMAILQEKAGVNSEK